MSLQSLKRDALVDVAAFFNIDVVANDPEKPTKAELLASLADGDEPVTWEDYKDIYLVGKAAEPKVEPEDLLTKVKAAAAEPVDTSNYVLIRYDRNNPTYEVLGFRFTKKHPFASVPPEVASHLVRNLDGFRLALPEELTEYYS